MEKENSDLEKQSFDIIEACEDGIENSFSIEEKIFPLEGKNEQIDANIKSLQQIVVDEPYDKMVLEDRKEVEVVIVDEPCDEKVHKNGKEVDVLVFYGTKRWHLKLRKKVVWPIKRILATRKKTCDEAKRIEEAPIVMNLSPSMEILQHKDIEKKDAKVPKVNQIDEFIYDEVPFSFSNPFIAGL